MDTSRKVKGSPEKSRIPSQSVKRTVPVAKEMDEDEQVLPSKSKAKDSFTHLIKMTFMLNGFMCKCSNKDTLSVVLL